jgi:pimeloyl-ACP methyl ester carboxylesterase
MPAWFFRDVTAQGTRLRVTEAGQGEPVVFLHGLFEDRRSWDEVMLLLAASHRVVSVDLAGFGESEKPPAGRFAYSVPAFAELVCDLYGGLELGRAALVGHGLGGAIALSLAANRPELVSHLVLVSALSYQAEVHWFRRLGQAPLIGSLLFKQLLGKAAFRHLHREYFGSGGTSMPTLRADDYYASFNSPEGRSSALATLRATWDTRPFVADIARVGAASLVIWGRQDRVFPVALGQRLARELRGAGLRLLDAGHCPHEEQPEAVAAMIADFIRLR